MIDTAIEDSVDKFAAALLALDHLAAAQILTGATTSAPGAWYLDDIVVPALVAIGDGWSAGEVSLSQVYMSGRMCQRLIADLAGSPALLRPTQPRLAIGVLDDSHVLGKQIVVHLLRSSGYQVSDWGARLSVEDMVEAAVDERPDVLFVSVLMLRSALMVAQLRQRLHDAGLDTIIVVGGAPFRFDPGLAGEVGADFVGESASDALPIMAKIEALLNGGLE